MEYNYKSINPDKNRFRFRFYSMYIERSLFGEFILSCTWGRIGTRGRTKNIIFDTLDECMRELKRIMRVRERHGYSVSY